MARIPESVIQQVLDSVDVVDLVGEYLSLKRSGSHYKGLCPFHQEKTPSFTVNPSLRIFKCFGCGKGGNVIGFLMEAEGLGYREAVRQLAEKAGIPFHLDGEESPERRTRSELLYRVNEEARDWFIRNLDAALRGQGPLPAYLEKRGLDHETRKHFLLGFAPEAWSGFLDHGRSQGFDEKLLVDSGLVIEREDGRRYDRYRGRLIFPIRNVSGSVIGFGGRVVGSEDKGAKYINSPETELYHKGRELYGIFEAKNEIRLAGSAVLVEGYMDVISLWKAGFRNAVASLGTALTQEQALLLKRFCDSVIFLYDGDDAGQKAMARGAESLLAAGLALRVCRLPQGLDPDDAVSQLGQEGFRALLEASEDYFLYRIAEYRRRGQDEGPRAYRDFVTTLLSGALRIADTLQRHEQLQRISRASGIPTDELLELGKELQRADRPRPEEESPRAELRPESLDREGRRVLGLFQLFMRNPELRDTISDELDLGGCEHPLLRAAFSGALEAHLDPETSVDSWAHALENPALRRLALDGLVEEPRPGDARECDDLLFNLRQNDLRTRLKEIQRSFASPEELPAGERAALEQEFVELNRHLRELLVAYRRKHR